MKLTKTFFASALLMLTATGFTSCNNDDDDPYIQAFINFNSENITYSSSTKAWDKVYDSTADKDLKYGEFQFSHQGFKSEFGDYFYGFCPTKSNDTKAAENLMDNQWSAITGESVIMTGNPYMVAYWNEYGDKTEGGIENGTPSCAISCVTPINPIGVYVTNSTYAYYAMKNGTKFNSKFGANDYFRLHIYGQLRGLTTGSVTVDLAKGTDILDKWYGVSLLQLGKVDTIYFTLESSDTGEYGMNTPAYFCLDGFTFEPEIKK